MNRTVFLGFLSCVILSAPLATRADTIAKPHTFTAGTPAQAEEVNANFDTVYDQVNKVGGAIEVDGMNKVGIGTAAPTAKLDVLTTPIDTYGNWLPYDAYYSPCEHCSDTCDGNHVAEYNCPGGQVATCEDIRNDNGEDWEYRSVRCGEPRQAAQFTGNVAVTGGSFAGDGSGLTSVNSELLDGQHASDIIAAASDGIPPSWHQILPASERFVLVMNNEAVLDKETGLVWERSPPQDGSWWALIWSYCADLNTGGRRGWRLPSIDQISSLLDMSVGVGPKIPMGSPFDLDCLSGGCVKAQEYWTANPFSSGSGEYATVNLSNGAIASLSENFSAGVWCVRGGQSVYDFQ